MRLEETRSALLGAIDAAGLAISVLGVLIIAAGMVVATWRLMRRQRGADSQAYVLYRREVGQAILLGLEFLVAADIIETVALAPTVDQIIVLAGIVFIRTFLSLALQVEIEGRWPWQSRKDGGKADALS